MNYVHIGKERVLPLDIITDIVGENQIYEPNNLLPFLIYIYQHRPNVEYRMHINQP